MSWIEQRPHGEIAPYWTQTYDLKLEHGDLAGQADTLGSEGTYLLFFTSDYDRAMKLLGQDLAILKKMGDEGRQCERLNKLAMARFKRAEGLADAEREPERRLALAGAQESLEMALALEREGDILFAAKSVLEFACELDDTDAFDAALPAAMNRDVWGQFQKLKKMLTTYEELTALAETLGRGEQLNGILEIGRESLQARDQV